MAVATLLAWAGAASAEVLGIDFIDSPANGAAMNARGDVVGTVSTWPCGDPHACAPTASTVVWRAEGRLPLPGLGTLRPAPAAIAGDGLVAGTVTDTVAVSRAVVWRFTGGRYEVVDLGLLPGTSSAAAVGMDAAGRVVGTATSPTGARPFYWTAATGLVDLASLGFPAESVVAVSPAGRVATATRTYRLDDPTSVRGFAAPPKGYAPPFGYAMRVNDAGDVGTFLATTTSEPVFYLHRYHAADGRWQLLSSSPNGNLSRWNVGGIDDDRGITATVTSVGVVADGPDGVATGLAGRLSPAYGGVSVDDAGMRLPGTGTLALATIGRSPRLVRLVPLAPCSGYCLRVAALQMTGVFVDDPRAPGSCTPAAANKVSATLTVTDADGNPVAGARVNARFLDDYALNAAVSGKTNARGKLVLRHRGPACVGAVALLVDGVTHPAGALDRSVGVLTQYVIPLP